jgi:hypothetical protein
MIYLMLALALTISTISILAAKLGAARRSLTKANSASARWLVKRRTPRGESHLGRNGQ